MERSLRCFLQQDYEGEHTLLIYNNSETSQTLAPLELPPNKHVHLINCSIDAGTGLRYHTLGAIYNDAIKIIPADAQIVIFWDDDDIYLPKHISEGVDGFKKVQTLGYKAYKPFYSFYRHAGGIAVVANNMEPSVFVDANHIKEYGCSPTTSDQHLKWYNALGPALYADASGAPTLVYNWGDTQIPTFKTSGNPGNPQNFDNYRAFSQEHGDGVLTPISVEEVRTYYDQVYSHAN
jgi:hypothetical protein